MAAVRAVVFAAAEFVTSPLATLCVIAAAESLVSAAVFEADVVVANVFVFPVGAA